MKRIMAFMITVLFAGTLFAQAPDTLWTKTYGGNGTDSGVFAQQLKEGGYIVFGQTDSYGAGSDDFLLIKTDSSGEAVWTRTYGGNETDRCSYGQQTNDGGFILVGHFYLNYQKEWDIWLVRTDSIGDTLWTRTFGGDGEQRASLVQQTSDDGFIITGYTDSLDAGGDDIWLIRTDSSGDTLWTQTYGGSEEDWGYSVKQTIDEGFIVLGHTYSENINNSDMFLIRTDSSGDTLWTKTYGGNANEYGHDVLQTEDGGYILLGRTWSYGSGGSDIMVIRTDSTGNMLWLTTYGGSSGELSSQIIQTDDGGFIISGTTRSYGAGNWDIIIIRIDSLGNEIWTRTYGGNSIDIGTSVQKIGDKGVIVAGYSESFGAGDYDVWLIRLESEYNPSIIGVDDVSDDQGGWVYLSWYASLLDTRGEITQYGIWELNPLNEWVSLGSTPAVQEDQYIYLAHTFEDSTPEGNNWSEFMVTAHTSDPAVFYTSIVDSGYSIDNLAPSPPSGLLATPGESNITLTWTPVRDEDFAYYTVYRSRQPGFDPDTMDSYDTSVDTLYSDLSVVIDLTYYYRISAFDFNGNESEYSGEASAVISGVGNAEKGRPSEFSISQNYPNPFNPVTEIRYAIHFASDVLLIVYNVRGVEVARLVDGRKEAGFYQVTWNASDVASGVYFCRLQAAGFTEVRKMVVLK